MAEWKQEHHGSGDNVGGDKYITYHIHGQTRHLPRLLTSLPRLDTRLIGRETEMENLAKVLDSGDKVLLVNGMGGVGKTTLAMAYANRFQDQYVHIAWVEQLDDLPTSLLANTVLLKNLDYAPGGDPENDARILLNQLANLGGDSKSLLVIDNATEKLTPFKDDLPHPPHWHVLITSRENLGSFTWTIELDFLPEEKALELFFEHYKLDQDKAAAKEIISLVDRHTLTVELLARTAQERLIQPLARFAGQLREQGLKISRKMDLSVLHSRNRKIEKLFPYLLAIFEWTPTSPEVERLLKQFVALPSIFLPLEILAELIGIFQDQEEEWDNFTLALKSLIEKGWIQMEQGKSAFKMHRLLQDVLEVQVKPSFEDLGGILSFLVQRLFIDPDKDNPAEKIPWIQFGRHLEKFLPLEWEPYGDIEKFFSNLATIYLHIGLFKESAELFEKIISVIQKNGEESNLFSNHLSNLAVVYNSMGKLSAAAELLEEAIERDKSFYGEDHLSVIIRQSNLASVLLDLDRPEEAIKIYEKVLNFNASKFGKNHPAVGRAESNLGSAYLAVGRNEEARELLEHSIQILLAEHGEFHPSIAIRLSTLGIILKNLGKYDESRTQLEKSLVIATEIFGEFHPIVATSQTNLATTYYFLERREESRFLFERALPVLQYFFGNDHPRTQTVIKSLQNLVGG